MTLAPPGSAEPAVTAEEARQAVDRTGIRPDVTDTTQPTATLARYTSTLGLESSNAAAYSDELAWVITYPDAPVIIFGGYRPDAEDDAAPRKGGNCDLNAIVLASTAEVVNAFQDC